MWRSDDGGDGGGAGPAGGPAVGAVASDGRLTAGEGDGLGQGGHRPVLRLSLVVVVVVVVVLFLVGWSVLLWRVGEGGREGGSGESVSEPCIVKLSFLAFVFVAKKRESRGGRGRQRGRGERERERERGRE